MSSAVGRTIGIAYLILTAAVVVRVFAPAANFVGYRGSIIVAGVLWTLAFILYLTVYAPILWRPRVDGRPG